MNTAAMEFTEQDKRMLSLMRQCQEIQVFRVGGRTYTGHYVDACLSFIKNNPDPADFSVWLQDNWPEAKL